MRILEIILAVMTAGNLLQAFVNFIPRSGAAAVAVPLALAVALLAQLGLEKYRWQMLPLYILALLVLALTAPAWLNPGSAAFGWLSKPLAIAGLVICVPAILLPVLFPIPRLPPPAGPYQVGTYSEMLVDATRREIYSGKDEPRAIMVQFWYPATPAPGSQKSPWIEHAEIVAPIMAEWLGFPRFFLDHLTLVQGNSFLQAPIDPSGAPYPVILFSHGWSGLRVQSTYLMEALASQGYVVVSIEHTYGAQVVVFPDGRIARNNPSALPYNDPPEVLLPAANRLVDQWAGDIGFVLDTLNAWNTADPAGRLTGRLDLSRVGISGHSTGGGAAVEFCGRDPRCTAGLGLDAYMIPVTEQVLDQGVPQPFLFLFSERWPSEWNTGRFARLFSASPQAQEITIRGTAHYDFADLPMLSPLAPYLGLKGPLSARRALQINSDFAIDFFDKTLRGGAGSRLQGPNAAYPEALFDYLP